jgi:hypothetical protein
MRKYVVRADSESGDRWFEPEPRTSPLTVFEPSDEPQDTGLLDAQGNKLMAVNELDPIGLVREFKAKA